MTRSSFTLGPCVDCGSRTSYRTVTNAGLVVCSLADLCRGRAKAKGLPPPSHRDPGPARPLPAIRWRRLRRSPVDLGTAALRVIGEARRLVRVSRTAKEGEAAVFIDLLNDLDIAVQGYERAIAPIVGAAIDAMHAEDAA